MYEAQSVTGAADEYEEVMHSSIALGGFGGGRRRFYYDCDCNGNCRIRIVRVHQTRTFENLTDFAPSMDHIFLNFELGTLDASVAFSMNTEPPLASFNILAPAPITHLGPIDTWSLSVALTPTKHDSPSVTPPDTTT